MTLQTERESENQFTERKTRRSFAAMKRTLDPRLQAETAEGVG